MATEREYDPPAMTEDERLAKRRFEAYFAFETQPQPKRMLSPDQFKEGPSRRRAGDVEIGHTVRGERVSGWFHDAKGKMVLEHGGRWNTYHRNELLEP